MRGDRDRPQQSHENDQPAEVRHLEPLLRADRQPQAQHAHERRKLEHLAPHRPDVAPQRSPRECHENHDEERPADRGRQSRARHAEPREPEIPEDQQPVEQDVREVAQHDRDDDRSCQSHRLEQLTEDQERVEGEKAGNADQHVRRGQRHQLLRLPERAQHVFRRQQQRSQDEAHYHREQQTALHRQRDGFFVLRSHGLRDERIQDEQHAQAEHRDHEEIKIPDRCGGERFRREPPHHDRVHHAHHHQSDLDDDDRRSERDQRAEFAPGGTQ